ncbi:MAG: hypothetical protein RMJ05_10160 [Thermomicrobium sp.]|nr:hypothetical protein [Thermomicrobium sp.]
MVARLHRNHATCDYASMLATTTVYSSTGTEARSQLAADSLGLSSGQRHGETSSIGRAKRAAYRLLGSI